MIQRGEVLYRGFYVRADRDESSYGGQRQFHCVDLDRRDEEPINVRGNDIVGSFISASEFDDTVGSTQTELAEVLTNAGPLPFTIAFVKANGEMRKLTGRLVSSENLLGRSMVYDFDVTKGTPLRLVDHRTIQWITIENTRYVLKG